MTATVAPPGANAALWSTGHALRAAHTPTAPWSQLYPVCRLTRWPCPDYLRGIALMRQAQHPPRARRAVGTAPVPPCPC